jgi:hypothetical protein
VVYIKICTIIPSLYAAVFVQYEATRNMVCFQL